MSPKYKQLNLEGLEENMDTKLDEKIVAEPMKMELPHVKHIFLGIDRMNLPSNPMKDTKSAYEAEMLLEGYYQKGYRLFEVQISAAPDFYQMMYVLVRE